MKKIRTLLALCLLSAIGLWLPAQRSLIKVNRTRVIAKLDLYWSAVTIAENFPTFFPLAVEINAPKKRFSLEATISPGYRKFNTPTTINNQFSLWGGLGLRYYFLTPQDRAAATGFFVEPQYFLHFKRSHTDPIVTAPQTTVDFNSGFFVGLGYQHVFWEWLYLQGRVSAGLGSDEDLSSYRVGNNLMVLPWVGIGIALH